MHNPERNFPYINRNLSSFAFPRADVRERREYDPISLSLSKSGYTIVIFSVVHEKARHNKSLIPAE